MIVTPHAAYYSEESIRLARETAASEVARVLTGAAAAKSRQLQSFRRVADPDVRNAEC